MSRAMRIGRGRSRGQALVEFALAVPVLLVILVGLFDFGRAIFAYNSLSNAAREGARVAIVDQTVVNGVPVGATEAANQATGLGLNPADATQVQVSYLMPDLSGPCATRSLGCIAEVSVRYQFRAITPIVGGVIGPINLQAKTQLPIEFTKP
jgi:TadE-like protein